MTNNKLVNDVCKYLSEKLAVDIKIVEIKGMTDIADFFVICSGKSVPQVKAIYDNLCEQMEKQNVFARRSEGITEGRWIAIDYADVIVHIFHKETRDIYALDTLWNNGGNVTAYEN